MHPSRYDPVRPSNRLCDWQTAAFHAQHTLVFIDNGLARVNGTPGCLTKIAGRLRQSRPLAENQRFHVKTLPIVCYCPSLPNLWDISVNFRLLGFFIPGHRSLSGDPGSVRRTDWSLIPETTIPDGFGRCCRSRFARSALQTRETHRKAGQ
jgi:hypothetical protein